MRIFITIYDGTTACNVHQKMSVCVAALLGTVVGSIKLSRLHKFVHDLNHFTLVLTNQSTYKNQMRRINSKRFSIN